jgi:toxin ParE1/3/4
MSRFALSPMARADLESIFDFTLEQWATDQAERYARLIDAAIRSMADRPERGASCDAIRAGYRKCAIGSHIVFYRLTAGGIDVVRILHQRMDFESHL